MLFLKERCKPLKIRAMNKTIEITRAQKTMILSCITERKYLYPKEIEKTKDTKSDSRMDRGYKKRIELIKEIQILLGFQP